jgi:hypothetical protein
MIKNIRTAAFNLIFIQPGTYGTGYTQSAYLAIEILIGSFN